MNKGHIRTKTQEQSHVLSKAGRREGPAWTGAKHDRSVQRIPSRAAVRIVTPDEEPKPFLYSQQGDVMQRLESDRPRRENGSLMEDAGVLPIHCPQSPRTVPVARMQR